MRAFSRKLAAWSVALTLLAGLFLPLTARFDVTDTDGVCGPSLVFTRSLDHFEGGPGVPSGNHCTACHLRHDLAGAFVSTVVQVAHPIEAVRGTAGLPEQRPGAVVIAAASPRGPPAIV